jgi:hypothetical protein
MSRLANGELLRLSTHPALRAPCLEKVLYLGKAQDRTFRSQEGIFHPLKRSLV